MPSVSFESSIDIAVPPDDVYSYVADFPRHIEWNEQPERITKLTDGPIQVGSRFETKEGSPSDLGLKDRLMMGVMLPLMLRRYGGSPYTFSEITTLEPRQRVAWKAHLPSSKRGDLMRMEWEIVFEPNSAGTRVTQRGKANPPDESPFASMVNEDMGAHIETGIDNGLRSMKSILEDRTDRSGGDSRG